MGDPDGPPLQLLPAIDVFLAHDVEFLVVGGVAANAHGAERVTNDLDLVVAWTPENRRRNVGRIRSMEHDVELVREHGIADPARLEILEEGPESRQGPWIEALRRYQDGYRLQSPELRRSLDHEVKARELAKAKAEGRYERITIGELRARTRHAEPATECDVPFEFTTSERRPPRRQG